MHSFKTSDIDKLETLCSRSPMKVRDFDRWEDDYGRNYYWKQLSRYTVRFIEKHIGDDYNDTFNKWRENVKKQKYPEYFDYEGIIHFYEHRFAHNVGACYGSRWNRWSEFTVDDNNRIIKNPYYNEYHHSKRKINVVESTPIYYTFNWENYQKAYAIFVKKYPDILNPDCFMTIAKVLGKSKTNQLIAGEKITPAEYTAINDKLSVFGIIKSFEYGYPQYSIWDCYCTEPESIYKGSKEYAKVRAYEKTVRNQNDARWKEKYDTIYNETLARLEANKIAERKRNEIDRDRLGFDADSFTGEAYQGEKRKKLKNAV